MRRCAAIWILCCALLMAPIGAAQDYSAQVLAHNRTLTDTWHNVRPTELPNDRLLAAKAAEISAHCETDYEIVGAVHDWICANLYFDRDALAAGIYHHLEASEVLRYRFSVCEGISNLTQALLLSLDVPCRKVWGYAIPTEAVWDGETAAVERINHTWLAVFADGRWFPVDCTMDLTNYYENGVLTDGPWNRHFFDPEEEFFAHSHKVLHWELDVPQDIPSPWAQAEVLASAENALSLALFCDYQGVITQRELRQLLGLPGGEDAPCTRLDGALLCAESVNLADVATVSTFEDVAQLPVMTQKRLMALQGVGILRGTGNGALMPDMLLTRQETLAILARCRDRKG